MDRAEPRDLQDSLVSDAAVRDFLDAEGLGVGEVEINAIAGGHSNLTFGVTQGERQFVLRRPPKPPLSPSAHDVIREARILHGLDGRARAPRVLAMCRDEAVIGAPFYIMERMPGVVLTDRMPDTFDRAAARRLTEELVDVLSELHALEPRVLEQLNLDRPTPYLVRQLRRFSDLWRQNQTREVPEIDAVGEWLASNRPQSSKVCIVHGDFRLGNTTVLGPPAVRIGGLLDWEMATIGDPLVDLGYLLAGWPVEQEEPTALSEIGAALRAPGCLTRDEACASYCERNEVATPLTWYIVLALWKAAIFLEGSRKRFLAGTTDDPYYTGLGEAVPRLGEAARELAGMR